MTSEHLLDAIGLLDDELIQEAEQPVIRAARPVWRRWAALAACLALVAVLGVRYLPIGMGGGDSAGEDASAGGAASSGGAPSQGAASEGAAAEPSGGGAAGSGNMDFGSGQSGLQEDIGTEWENASNAFDDEPGMSEGRIWGLPGEPDYQISNTVVDVLPPDCREVGTLGQTGQELLTGFHTGAEDYVGCILWAAPTGERLYIQLPQGGYAVAERIEE